MSRISSANPPDEVTTPIRRPAGRLAPCAVASSSVNSPRSETSIARWARSSSEIAPGSPGGPPVWVVTACRVRACTPDLQHEDRLAEGGSASERRSETIRVPDGLDEYTDDRGVRVVDEVFEIIGRGQHGFVAGRDDMAETEPPDIDQQADADSTTPSGR
jgi:hypothetical protein